MLHLRQQRQRRIFVLALHSIMLLRHLTLGGVTTTTSGFNIIIIKNRPRGGTNHHHHLLLRKSVVVSSSKFNFSPTTFATKQKKTRLASISTSSSDNHVDDETTNKQIEHVVTWKTATRGNLQFVAYDGELLRTAALRSNVVSPHNDNANYINCRGLGTCGTCAIQIVTQSSEDDDDDLDDPNTKNTNIEPINPNAIERFRLSVPPGHGNSNETSSKHLRLACQIQVKGNITVQKWNGFWGQYYNTTLSDGSIPTKPFGQLEYILDTKSPTRSISKSSSEKESES